MRNFVLFLALTGSALSMFGADVVVIEEIICKVNGDIITRGDIERDRKQLEAGLRQEGLKGARLNEAISDGSKNFLRERIDQLLLVQKGKELDIKVDSEVQKQLAAIQRQLGIADPEKFHQKVHDEVGVPFEDYKAELTNQALRTHVIRQEVMKNIVFKKEDLQKYYEDHKDEFMRQERVFLREIFISTDGKDAAGIAAAEKKARDISARGKKGERFAEMAQANSDDPTAAQGGELPPYEKKDMRDEIVSAVWNVQKGFVTDPIKVPNGFLIFKVEEHQKAGLAEFEEVENEVQDKMYRPRMDPALRDYLTKLRAVAFLEIKPGYQDSGAAPGKDTSWADPAQLKPETVTKEEVAARGHRKKLLGMIPIPGTNTTKAGTSSSK